MAKQKVATSAEYTNVPNTDCPITFNLQPTAEYVSVSLYYLHKSFTLISILDKNKNLAKTTPPLLATFHFGKTFIYAGKK